MKIGFVIDDSLDFPDGVQQYVLTIGNWLRANGHEIHYITSTTQRQDIPNLHVLTRNVKVSFNRNTLRVPLPVSKKRANEFLEAEQFDILHVQAPYSPFFAGRLILGAPDATTIVSTFHIAPYAKYEARAGRLLAKISKKSLARVTSVCSVSEAAKAYTDQTYNTQSRVIPNAIDLQDFKPTTPKKKNNTVVCIKFLGRLVERKGCIWFLRAINHVAIDPSVRDRIKVHIAGRGTLLKDMQAYVTKHGLTDIVRFDGFIPEEGKAAYLAEADIAVFPSLSGESFGIVLLEAMATGRSVVIGGDNPGYKTVMGPIDEQLINPKETNNFSLLLNKYIMSSTERKSAIKKQNKLVAQYDVSVVGRQIEDLYDTAISAKRV